MSVLEALVASPLAASPLATTSTYSAAEFSLSEAVSSKIGSLISFVSRSININISSSYCIHWLLSIFSILSIFNFLNWLMSSFIKTHCFLSSITNVKSWSGCSSPLSPLQPAGASLPAGALVAPANWFRVVCNPKEHCLTLYLSYFSYGLSSIPSGPQIGCCLPPSHKRVGMGSGASLKALQTQCL